MFCKLLMYTTFAAAAGAAKGALFGSIGSATLRHLDEENYGDIISFVRCMAVGGALLWGGYGAYRAVVGEAVDKLLNGPSYYNSLSKTFTPSSSNNNESSGKRCLKALGLSLVEVSASIISGMLGYAFFFAAEKHGDGLAEHVAVAALGATEIIVPSYVLAILAGCLLSCILCCQMGAATYAEQEALDTNQSPEYLSSSSG